MRNYKLYEPYKRQGSETLVYGVLGVIGLVTLGLALVASQDFAREKDRVVAAWSGNTPVGSHFRSGTRPADGQTVTAMIRDLLEQESDPPTQNVTGAQESAATEQVGTGVRTFAANAVITELKGDGRTVLLSDESVNGVLGVRSLLVQVQDPLDLAGLKIGDRISFRLSVSATQAWIGGVRKVGEV